MRTHVLLSRWRVATTVALFTSVLAGSAAVQDALIVDGHFVSAQRNFGEDLGRAPADVAAPLAGGGRYAVRGASILDRRTGASVPIPELATVLAVDPILPRVVIRFPGTLFAVIAELNAMTGITRPLILVAPTEVPTESSVRYAHAAGRLFVDVSARLFQNPYVVFDHEVRIFDAATGAPLPGGFTFTAASNSPWMVTPEGDFAYVSEPGGLAVINPTTGDRHAVPQPVTAFYWDELNERVYASAGFTVVALTRDGAVMGSAPMGDCFAARVSPHTGRLYIRRGQQSTYGSIEDVRVFDARTYALLGRYSLPFRIDCTVSLLSAPGPPRAVRASVSGRDVTLEWTNVGAASHFVLDVGFGPGRTDASAYLRPDTPVTFANVPSGTYYLRLRGGNEFGGGRASSEIQVVVP